MGSAPRVGLWALLGVSLAALAALLLLCLPPARMLRRAPAQKYGIVLDAGSSHTALFVYQWPADKENETGIVSQHSMCDVQVRLGGPVGAAEAGHGGGAGPGRGLHADHLRDAGPGRPRGAPPPLQPALPRLHPQLPLLWPRPGPQEAPRPPPQGVLLPPGAVQPLLAEGLLPQLPHGVGLRLPLHGPPAAPQLLPLRPRQHERVGQRRAVPGTGRAALGLPGLRGDRPAQRHREIHRFLGLLLHGGLSPVGDQEARGLPEGPGRRHRGDLQHDLGPAAPRRASYGALPARLLPHGQLRLPSPDPRIWLRRDHLPGHRLPEKGGGDVHRLGLGLHAEPDQHDPGRGGRLLAGHGARALGGPPPPPRGHPPRGRRRLRLPPARPHHPRSPLGLVELQLPLFRPRACGAPPPIGPSGSCSLGKACRSCGTTTPIIPPQSLWNYNSHDSAPLNHGICSLGKHCLGEKPADLAEPHLL
ncbi:ectonucleoside triphosphate diphosphohydrolase 2 isoform X3 [Anolis carolinensis]|uniref:ectonucleoside triphosphate diphosphohydrolase 2 isoform X3 n=1 Tax=Anolis carolinensis TaxID=28377 RepID=UPI002F2B57BA